MEMPEFLARRPVSPRKDSYVEQHPPLVFAAFSCILSAFTEGTMHDFLAFPTVSEVCDCLQAGMEGLVTGLMKFDPNRGTRLSTYLVHWIRQGISLAIAAHGKVVSTPRHHQYAILKLKRERRQLTQSLRRRAFLSMM